MFKKLILINFVIILISGCALTGKDLDKPEIEITSLNLMPMTGMEARFKIGLRIINPNREAFTVKGMSYNLNLDGFKVIRGVSSENFSVDAYSEKELSITASTSLFQSLGFIKDFISSANSEPMKYTFETKLDTGSVVMPATRISTSGTINLGSSN